MAEWEDAISNTCFTFVSISSNLILGTIDDYILWGKIVPYPAKKLKLNVKIFIRTYFRLSGAKH